MEEHHLIRGEKDAVSRVGARPELSANSLTYFRSSETDFFLPPSTPNPYLLMKPKKKVALSGGWKLVAL